MDDQHHPQPPVRQPLPPQPDASPTGDPGTPQNLPIEPVPPSPAPDPLQGNAQQPTPETSGQAVQQFNEQHTDNPPQNSHSDEPFSSNQNEPEPAKVTEEKARDELHEAIQQSNEILATARTVNPFFPDIFTLDRAKVTVARKGMLGSAEVMSLRVEDLLNVTASVGILLGTLQISNRIANQQTTSIGPFWRTDALRIKRITQGYVIAMQREIDLSSLTTTELKSMLERLGEDDHPNTYTGEPAD